MPDRDIPPFEPTDEALVARVALGDVAAFSLLYDRYARAVYVPAVYVLGDDEAEEIVQEVFMRFWSKAEQFDPLRGSFAAWLMTIARNRIKDRLRRRSHSQRIIAAETIEDLLAETPDPSINVEEESWLRARGDVILRGLRRLPEEQRRVLILAYFGGLSQAAIAEELALPLGTVKKRARLGLQKLRMFLVGEGVESQSEQTEPGTGGGL